MLVTLPDNQQNDLLIQADGTSPRQLGGENGPASDARPASWSPTSRELAVWGPLDSTNGVWVTSPDGGPGHMVAEGVTNAAWSPAGDLIAGISSSAEGDDVVVFAPDGSARRVLADLPPEHGVLGPLGWSPEGRSVVFTAFRRPPVPLPPIRSGLPEGTRCGTPFGPGDVGGSTTVTAGHTTVMMAVTPCEPFAGDHVWVDMEVVDPSTVVLVGLDWGDGTPGPGGMPSCIDAGMPPPRRFSWPKLTRGGFGYAAPGRYGITATVTTADCADGKYGAPLQDPNVLTVTIPVFIH